MLELIAIIYFCKQNAARAEFGGKSRGLAYVYTIFLWFGFELVGLFIGGIMLGPGFGMYILALLFALVGALISVSISKLGSEQSL